MRNFIIIIFTTIAFIACKKQFKPIEPATPIYNILILGNSITYSPANSLIGWGCNCGMAASVADSDYVHLLTTRIQSFNIVNSVTAKNIAAFEVGFDNYNLDNNLKQYRDAKPDLIILRIGENVTRNADSLLFEQKYTDLLNYFKANNPNVKILAVGSVWPEREMPNKVLSRHSTYITLDTLQKDLSNYAFGLYVDGGVQAHPSNKGMKLISTQIWAAMQKMIKPDKAINN